jgi:hypothetical protein
MKRSAAGVTILVALLGGCQQDSLWQGSQSPTQEQTRQMDEGGQSAQYFDLNDGDNEDPNVDQGNFPGGGEPWWNSPGYIGG